MDSIVNVNMMMDEEQQLTLRLENIEAGVSVVVTLVYANCNNSERVALWESLEDMALSIQETWLVGGDFNVIVSKEEILRGLPFTVAKTKDFKHCKNICNLEDHWFKGSKYTWWNGRMNEECIFKRLD